MRVCIKKHMDLTDDVEYSRTRVLDHVYYTRLILDRS